MFFTISSYLIRPHATTSIAYTEPYAKQSQSNLLSKLYTDHNSLQAKHTVHQKAESLRAALFQSQTTRSTIQSTLNSLQNGRCSFISPYFVQTSTPTLSTKNPFLYFSQFSPPNSTLACSRKLILTIPTNNSLLYTSPIFDFLIFTHYHPNNLNQKCFPQLSYLANSGCVKGPGSQDVL